jgi:DNA-binding transcriptional ArsR family regulator
VPRPIYQVKADFFKTLGHPARIRVLELLREGEQTVAQLIPEVGLEPSHLSQQLSILRRAGVLESRKIGSSVVYSVTDARIFELLAVAKAILTTSLAGSQDLLVELRSLDFPDPAQTRRRENGHPIRLPAKATATAIRSGERQVAATNPT